MKVIITGAEGDLGHAVVRRLAEDGWRVASLGKTADADHGRFAAGDLADEGTGERRPKNVRSHDCHLERWACLPDR